ncbi:MAG: serine hydrolase domain-containing protein [Saprospiraceae bacterium]|nr:serine hydrolase domain-containing protein [Saprospiraceae bacterium]
MSVHIFRRKWLSRVVISRLSILYTLVLINPAADAQVSTETVLSQLKESVRQSMVEALLNRPDLPGIILHVEAPNHQISWSTAAGVRDPATGIQLTGTEGVRIASVTKTYVAAAILRLWEDGVLQLDDPIERYIAPEHQALLAQDGYDASVITIRHLLSHVSGMFDHGSSQQYFTQVLADPQRVWTRTDQIRGCVEWGEPVGRPGERFSYSDTGYILLGEVIEKISGQPLGIALRRLLNFDALQLQATWFELTEPRPPAVPDRAHQFVDSIDTYDLHPSVDLYGGGGLVTSVADMARFYQKLFDQKVFRNATTLDTMLARYPLVGGHDAGMDYRKGIYQVELAGRILWTHSGFWGTQVFYIPHLKASVAVAVTQQSAFGLSWPLLVAAIAALEELE